MHKHRRLHSIENMVYLHFNDDVTVFMVKSYPSIQGQLYSQMFGITGCSVLFFLLILHFESHVSYLHFIRVFLNPGHLLAKLVVSTLNLCVGC